ncbi:MAG: excinuclease ABC subunit UvrC [Clostridia bacterium]|nr:excinuclease ABC subunit UvrC [Clostridia bacterium]
MLKNLPEDPGVYIMKNKSGQVIYVGKAKVLKKRLKQYFQNTEKHTPKVKAMVSNIDTFEYILTDSELEALILECNLIKKYRPYYNILLKDDKNYPYIKVTVNEKYPRIRFVRRRQNDGARYFGPYSSSAAVHETIDLVCKTFKIPTCEIKLPRDIGRKRACINAQIDRCCAPCENVMSEQEYKNRIKEACTFLEGNASSVLDKLNSEMNEAAENLEFERAASIRDKINGILQMDKRQKIVTEKYTDEDIIGFHSYKNRTFAVVFFVRSGRLIGNKEIIMMNTSEMNETEVCSSFLMQFYQNDDYVPKNIYVMYECEDKKIIEEHLSLIAERKVNIHTPKRGEKKSLVEMAGKNAKQAALNFMLKNGEGNKGIKRIILDLKDELGLLNPPYRIESYDVSNISGKDNVGSMVVFINGEPKKSLYRRFKIDTDVCDDYKSMSEMIYRRIRNARDEEKKIENGELLKENAKFLPLPDCIFLDGGKGHLSVVSELLELIDTDIPLFAMVKDDKHRTSMLLREDGSSIGLKTRSEEFNLITRIQDEVHRFAIEYHKKLRGKHVKQSVLEEIDGVGSKTALKLLKHFKSVNTLKKANVDEIKNAGVSEKAALNIYHFFRK